MSKARDLASRANVPRKNYIINGGFDIWQRGTSFTATGYSADRWGSRQSTSTTTFSRQSFTLGQTDVPNNPEYFFRADITSIGSAQIYQMIEGVESLSGETVTLSFYAKAGSAVSLNAVTLRQNFGYGGAPSASVIVNFPNSTSLTTSWQKFEFSIVVPSVSGKTLGTSGTDSLELIFQLPSTSLATIDIAQVQLEKGSVATGFEYRPISEELALCQRYYEVMSNVIYATPRINSTTNPLRNCNWFYAVNKRVAPSVTYTENTSWGSSSLATKEFVLFLGTAPASATTTRIETATADAEL